MNFYKKKKIQDSFRKHWKVWLSTGILLLATTIILIVGFSITGWSIVKWLKSGYATTLAIVVILGLAGIGAILVLDWKKNNWRK